MLCFVMDGASGIPAENTPGQNARERKKDGQCKGDGNAGDDVDDRLHSAGLLLGHLALFLIFGMVR